MQRKSLLFVAVALVVGGQPLSAFAQQPQLPEWYWAPWQFWWICPLMMLAMLAIAATVFLVFHRSAGGGHLGPPRQPPDASALQILNERFARGEIDLNEYAERRRLLQA